MTLPQIAAYMKYGATPDPFGLYSGGSVPSSGQESAPTMQQGNTDDFAKVCRDYALAHGGEKGEAFRMTWDEVDKWEKLGMPS